MKRRRDGTLDFFGFICRRAWDRQRFRVEHWLSSRGFVFLMGRDWFDDVDVDGLDFCFCYWHDNFRCWEFHCFNDRRGDW